MTPFLVTLKAFNEVRKKCFRATGPDPDYKESIQKFKESYFNLNLDFGISITPVVHDVCFHLQPFMEKYPEVFLGLQAESPVNCESSRTCSVDGAVTPLGLK